ncbi:hypothetical protein BpHYR1_017108 [Brachionus plicatilis]|uniref:RNA-directed DNA polymerase from mobile element jockey-like n=1 Tax=Brachionus plicatilis TaxID=10195 RepID=A0A3M7SY24_BRAPC|nr:hypothetical protein BpHYR1_017108 [Brachionus plicatilis]
MQNRVLRIIKYFPLKTSIKTIHKELRIDLIDDRANKLFSKFITTRQSHEIIAQEIQDFLFKNSSRNNLKYKTPFDSIINTSNSYYNYTHIINTYLNHIATMWAEKKALPFGTALEKTFPKLFFNNNNILSLVCRF